MDQLTLGWARREISTSEPVSIKGQMHLRISEGILDPLYVTALALDGGRGQDHLIFLSCDVVALPWDVVTELRQAVNRLAPDINPDWIVVSATHTHASLTLDETPAVSPDGRPIFPGMESRRQFVTLGAEAVAEAWHNRKPGGFAYGYGYAVVAHSRRVCYFHDQGAQSTAVAPNGHCIMYGNTNDPDFSHYEGGADHFVNLLYTFDESKKLTGILINVPCPSQVTEQLTQLSADYWHEVRQLLAEEFGPEVNVLPQCAAAGDLAPRILHYLDAQARRMGLKHQMPYDAQRARQRIQPDDLTKRFAERRDIAERITAAVKEVYPWASKQIFTHVPLRHQSWLQPMRRRVITDRELAECEQKLARMEQSIPVEGEDPVRYRKAVSNYNSVKNRNAAVLRRYEAQKTQPELPNNETHVIALGEIAFATNKFELYQDYMHRVQARSPFIQTFVLQLTGDGAGTYLATERSQKNKGYGASLYCNWAGHEGGQQWVEAVLERLEEMYNTQGTEHTAP